MTSNNDEFWKAIREWQATPVADPNILYRLYYDDQGQVLFYSMEDLPGNYIDIDRETYTRGPSNVRVRNGQLQYIKTAITAKLVPNVDSGTPCHPSDVAVVVADQTCTKWGFKTNESN